MKPLFFVHIPKTAGTSLNKAATEYFGLDAIEQDYGPASKVTSPLVQQYIYGDTIGDTYGCLSAQNFKSKRWLTGHVFAEKYTPLIGAENTLSIVRDPVDRVVSEYNHRISKEGETRSLPDFYRDPHETNKQFRMIGQLPWQAFHLVGLQDRYGEFISLLNATKNTALKPLKINKGDKIKTDSVDAETRADIEKWNERDCIFVEQVRTYFGKQITAHQENQPFCYHDMDFRPGKHIIGWAFYQHTDTPVQINLFADGQLVETITAVEYRSELHSVLAPRAGHCGFRFVLEKYADAQSVLVKTKATNQTLIEWQR